MNLTYRYTEGARQYQKDVLHIDGSTVMDKEGRTVGASITVGNMVAREDPDGKSPTCYQVPVPGDYIYVHFHGTVDGCPSGYDSTLEFFNTQEQADAHIADRFVQVRLRPSRKARQMPRYNTRLRHDQRAWLRRQPNASKVMRDALDLWTRYMVGDGAAPPPPATNPKGDK